MVRIKKIDCTLMVTGREVFQENIEPSVRTDNDVDQEGKQ